MERLVAAHHAGAAGPRLPGGDAARGQRGAKRGADALLPLTVPEVRRRLVAVTEPPERFACRLAWSVFRRRHQATAKACHAARRARPVATRSSAPRVQALPAADLALTDEHWARIAPLLPPQKPRVGRPMLDHRQIVGGMLWVAGTGASRRALPAEFGPWETVYSRYRRWRDTGIWQRIIATLQQAPDGSPR